MRVLSRIKSIGPKSLLIFGGSLIGLGAFLYATSLVSPRNLAFSYAGNNCYLNPIIAPGLLRQSANPTYKINFAPTLRFGNATMFSSRTCVQATGLPKENAKSSTWLRAFGFLPIKHIGIKTSSYPMVLPKTALDKPVSTSQSVQFEISQSDQIFDYKLVLFDQTADCHKEGRSLDCPINDLVLKQSAKYDLVLTRVYPNSEPHEILEAAITTVEPIKVTASSIAPGQTVYDAPADMTLTLNLPATVVEGLDLVDGSGQSIPVSHTLSGNLLVVKFGQPLPRNQAATLTINQIKTDSGNQLDSPYSLGFFLSGGPKVIGVSIGHSKAPTSGKITIKLDAAIAGGQNLAALVGIDGIATTVKGSGSTITIQPKSAMAKCSRFSIRIADGLKNQYGISGGSAWSFNSRTICYDLFSIGNSVRGRSINAYRFGSGSKKLLFVGNTHGNEKSSTYLLNSWIDYLEANYDAIGNRTIIVVPQLNPDGFATNRRTNANNVDLNRNFPASDWKAAVTGPSYGFLPTGGGAAPLSEPETRAIASFIQNQRPNLVLTYHSHGGIVMPNEAGNSVNLARLYDQRSNVGYLANSSSSSVFTYDTTGAMEQWLHDKLGIAALLIELWTDYGNEFRNHQSAMWAMVQSL